MRLSHKRNAIADRERYFVLAISDMHEKIGAGIPLFRIGNSCWTRK